MAAPRRPPRRAAGGGRWPLPALAAGVALLLASFMPSFPNGLVQSSLLVAPANLRLPQMPLTHLKLQLHPQPWSWATARPRQQSDVRPARRASVGTPEDGLSGFWPTALGAASLAAGAAALRRFRRRPPLAAAPPRLCALSAEAPVLRPAEPHLSVPHEALGFALLRRVRVPEIDSEVALYRHVRTGAEVLSLANADTNKVFATTFRTTPGTSTGVPHILEHSVLCGSRKYPLKEPFVELLKGSLHTFLNAYTYPDKTCYPVASCNLRDFYNLVDVYLDAVFHPAITEETLMQEGWHFELESAEGPLTYKGVVFNEMKGVYSQPESILWKVCQEELFPDPAVTYSVDSGGDPRHIPDLTFEEFVHFYKTHYHPSNARFFFYGDDPLEERLRILARCLEGYDAHPGLATTVRFQPPFDAPRRRVDRYPIGEAGETEGKTILTVNWVLTFAPLDEEEEEVALALLDDMLMGNNAAVLRRALNESELGESVVGGLDDTLQQRTFSCGLKNIDEEDAEEVERLIFSTLETVARDGFSAEAIEASLNSTEFAWRELNTGSEPRGITLMMSSLRKWLYGNDPIAPLAFEAPLAAVKARLAAGEDVFRPLVRRYLLDNPHRVTVELRPDPAYDAAREAAEAARLRQLKEAMTPEDLQAVMARQRALQARQAAPDPPEALACVPTLRLEDLPAGPATVPTTVTTHHGVPILVNDLPTNGILYLDLALDLHSLPAELLPYTPLFADALTELGTHREDFASLLQRIQRKVGGVAQFVTVSPLPAAAPGEAAHLMLRAKGTAPQLRDLAAILTDVLLDTNFDNQPKFLQMVLEAKAEHEEHVVGEGHTVAVGRLAAMDHRSGWLTEQLEGLSYLFFLRRLAEETEADWPAVRGRLEDIQRRLVSRRGLTVAVTADDGLAQAFHPVLDDFLRGLPDEAHPRHAWQGGLTPGHEAIAIPTQVNYVAKGGNLYAHGYRFHGSAYVINKYLGMTWLWDRVRVMGGAYGAWSQFDRHSGHFTFASYRDPNTVKTLEAFDGAAEFLEALDLSEDALTKAIIGAIGEYDPYQLPDAKGYSRLVRHLLGVRDEDRQATWREILATTPAHFRDFAAALRRLREGGRAVVVGAAPDLDRAVEASPLAWTRIQAV